MTILWWLVEWALRSSALIAAGAALLWILRIRDASTRLGAWTAMLAGSFMIPLMTGLLPNIPVTIVPALTRAPLTATVLTTTGFPAAAASTLPTHSAPAPASAPFDWSRALLVLYIVVALAMLLRLCIGLVLSSRLIRQSRRTDKDTEGIAVLESRGIPAPVTLGIAHPVILLPENWVQWDNAKLNAILAHERSHILRRDPAVQLISVIHRALLWFSPLAWFLHSRIIRVAEEVSDDAAVAVTDRTAYAEILLDFMRCPEVSTGLAGIPMSRYGRADRRLHRILDATTLSRGLTRVSVITIAALTSPFVYVLATAQPRTVSPVQQTAPAASDKPASEVMRGPGRNGGFAAPANPEYLMALGTVTAAMVTVHPLVDGRLVSVAYRDGQIVKAGETLAAIDPKDYESQRLRAEIARNLAVKQFRNADDRYRAGAEPDDARLKAEGDLQMAEHNLQEVQRKVSDTKVKAPISGIAGLRLVEPGDIVHAMDEKGIAVIAQVQPISVIFTLPERHVQNVRIPLDAGQHPAVEAWSPDSSMKLAEGILTAMDNQIDPASGTIKLKARFENTDNRLFPNQFVNVRVHLK